MYDILILPWVVQSEVVMKRIKLTNYFTEATTIVMIDHIALIEPHQHNNEATGVLTLKGSKAVGCKG